MPYCTECGGKLVWDRKLRQYSCESCGMTLTEAQLSADRDRLRDRPDDDDQQRRRRHSEYLDWWTSSKKERR
jgi:transcription initiation factor TFIIIB Brf1 subunit/transcription initiation factor TFIIB